MLIERPQNTVYRAPFEKTKPILSFSVRRSEFSAKIRNGYLKKQSQFIRIAYCVMRIAKRDLKKQSQFAGGQNDVKLVIVETYGDLCDWKLRKNKANSKPNKAKKLDSRLRGNDSL